MPGSCRGVLFLRVECDWEGGAYIWVVGVRRCACMLLGLGCVCVCIRQSYLPPNPPPYLAIHRLHHRRVLRLCPATSGLCLDAVVTITPLHTPPPKYIKKNKWHGPFVDDGVCQHLPSPPIITPHPEVTTTPPRPHPQLLPPISPISSLLLSLCSHSQPPASLPLPPPPIFFPLSLFHHHPRLFSKVFLQLLEWKV